MEESILSNPRPDKSRLLCWVPSLENFMQDRVKAVNETWASRCDAHVFFIETKETDHHHGDVVKLGIKDGRRTLTDKSFAALSYLYHRHLNDYDWFLKGDDDAFVVVENLRFLLQQYNSSHPIYLGHLFKVIVLPAGYMSGGASYVLSREALRKMIEEGLQQNKCATKGNDEDVDVGRCLQTVGVAPHNSLDIYGRQTFHPEAPIVHIAENKSPLWLTISDRFPSVVGRNCCSELTISFHHMKPGEIRIMDYLLYRITVYGGTPDYGKLNGFFEAKPIPPLPVVT